MVLTTARRILAAFVAMSTVALPAATQRQAESTERFAAPRRAEEVVGYFPQWGIYNRRYVPLDLVKSGAIHALTQLDYAQTTIRNSACIVADPEADLEMAFKAEDSVDGQADAADSGLRGNFHQLQLLRKAYPRLRVLISIMGDKKLFEEAAKPQNRVAFVHSCVARFIEGHIAPGVEAPHLFDGIDVDWEYPDAAHADDYYALLAEFRRQMKAARPAALLTIATGASHKAIDPIDWKRVAASVDQIGVMTYDYEGPWSHDTGFVAPLKATDPNAETVQTTLDAYLSAGVPAHKLQMGLPFYAYQWHNVPPGANHGLLSKGDPVKGNLNQSTAAALLAASAKARVYRDPVSKAPWIYDGNNFLTYEDPTSVRAKAAYAREHGLGGIMIWELSGDTTDSQLLRALEPAGESLRHNGSSASTHEVRGY